MKILIAPLHYVISRTEGSEYTRSYENLEHIARDKNYSGDALVGYSELDMIGNFKIHKMLKKHPFRISNFIRIKFIFWVFIKSLELMSKHQYDLIWHQGPFSIGETFSLLAIFNPKKLPFIIGPIYTPHGKYRFGKGFGRFGLKTTDKISKFPTSVLIDYYIYQKFAKFFSGLSHLTLRKVNKIITVDSVGNKMIKKLGLRNTEVISISIINEDFKRKRNPIKKKKYLLLSVCYLIERKRTIDLIEAVRILVTKYKLTNIQLIIVGDGPQKHNLEVLMKNYKLEKYIKFEGFIPRTKISKYYKRADIFLSGSISDTMAAMYFEAMSASMPIVAAKNITTQELKNKKFGGYVTGTKKPSQIAEYVYRLIQDSNLIYRFGRKNYMLMEGYYNFEKSISRLKNNFELLVKGNMQI